MTQDYERSPERTATASADIAAIQPGWTVYDAVDRPIGNVTDVEGGRLGIDGRPEGFGYFDVPATAIRRTDENKVYLDLSMEQLRERGAVPVTPAARPEVDDAPRAVLTEDADDVAAATFQSAAPLGEAPTRTAPSAAPQDQTAAKTWTAEARETTTEWVGPRGAETRRAGDVAAGRETGASRHDDVVFGSSYTASGTPIGEGSNTPVGNEPWSYRDWDEQQAGGSTVGGFVRWLGPIAIGAASAGAYVWWRNRTRRGRLARVTAAFGAAGGSLAPVLDAARERKQLGLLAPLAALPLAYYLRAGSKGESEEIAPPDASWFDRFSGLSMPSVSMSALALPRPSLDEVEAPPTWTMAVPVVAAGLAAAWFAARGGRRPFGSVGDSRRVTDIMTRDVQVVRPGATLFEASSLMKRLDVGSLPVCDGRRLQGMLTDRDIVVRSVAESRDPQLALVRDAMTPDVVYAYEDDPIERAAELMRMHRIRRLPIVDRDKNLVGIVSLGDVAVDSGSDRLSGATLETISEPARPRR